MSPSVRGAVVGHPGLSCELEDTPFTEPPCMASRVVQVLSTTLQKSVRRRVKIPPCECASILTLGAIVPGDGDVKLRATYETCGIGAQHLTTGMRGGRSELILSLRNID